MLLTQAVVLAVVVSRVLVPLAIPRFPVPGLLASLVLDAVDQSVFQQFPGLDLAGYQGYDKALDVYYLTIAYVSTLRNWTDPIAFRIGQFLWYWRLVGVVAFELTGERWLLVVFANTVEYYVLAYEVVRLGWRPTRLSPRRLLALAGGIWVVVKLPQEWWIHVARLDLTDVVKERVLGAPAGAPWGDALRDAAPGVLLAATGAALVVAAVAAVVARRLPPRDWRFSADVDAHDPRADVVVVPAAFRRGLGALPGRRLLEKTVLITLLAVVFAEVLPGVRASGTEIVVTVAGIVAANSVLSWWLAGRGTEWSTAAQQFAVLFSADVAALLGYVALSERARALDPVATALFLALFCLVITLYDRYRNLRSVRDRAAPPGGARG